MVIKLSVFLILLTFLVDKALVLAVLLLLALQVQLL
jgi:hypothetical protein